MKRLLDAPHRIFFFAAAVQMVAVSAWWAVTLVARLQGLALPLADGIEPARAHGFVMIYGFFPLFIFGFLFTAGPRWLALASAKPRQYAAPALIGAVAAWLLLPALHLGTGAASFLMLFMLGAWGWMLGHFINMIVVSRVADRTHAIAAACAIGMGVIGIAAARVWLLTGSVRAAQLMEVAGLWGFLLPLFATVSHRMIPFFTSTAAPGAIPWHPAWTLAALAGGSLAHGALLMAQLSAWTWIVDLPVGAIAAYLAWRWGFARSLGNRLLTMVHVGFAWLAAAWLLHGLQSALSLADVRTLGLAPTHALTIGFLSSLALAMVSRVSCGHSGRSVGGDELTWNVFLLLQAAAVARVAADIWTGAYAPLLATAAWLWLACFAAWAWHYMPYYWERSSHGRSS